ncbi:hypothetical protein, partial [Pseudomonas viridiflava]
MLIEDGSLALGGEDLKGFGQPAVLSLRVGLDNTAGSLPRLELLCWHGSAKAQRLIVREWLPVEPSGNGRMLRDEAVAAWVD